MALHNLKITVVDGGKQLAHTEFGSDLKRPEQKDKKSLLAKVLNYNTTIKDSIKQAVAPTTFFAIQQGVNLAVQTGKQFINYYVSDIGRRTGDSNYQAIINRRIEQVSEPLSIAGGALAGAAAGSLLGIGPVGIVIGLIAGTASSAVNIGFSHATKAREYQHEMFKDSTSQAYQIARANYTIQTGRVR